MKMDLKEIIDKYSDKIYTIAMMKLCNEVDIDDVMQDVFLKLSDNLHKIKDEEHLVRWLSVATRNKAKNYNLCFWRRREVELKECEFTNKEFRDELLVIKDKVETLSDNYKETFRMHMLGYTYEEISKKLKITPEAARKRVERARELLKIEVSEEGEEK